MSETTAMEKRATKNGQLENSATKNGPVGKKATQSNCPEGTATVL